MAQWPRAVISFSSNGTGATFLPRAINHTLAATTDYLQQFVIAKVRERLCRLRHFLFMCFLRASLVRVDDPGYRFVREQIESGFN